MKKSGFTLLELIIVVAIISILAGVSVPYYIEYQTDARRSSLKANLGNFRKVLNDFRGDQNRGPFRVTVLNGAGNVLVQNPKTIDASGSELVTGPVQYVSTKWVRRTTVKYIPNLPLLMDPEMGDTLNWDYGTCSAYFEDRPPADGKYDISSEFAFKSASGSYDAVNDTVISPTGSPVGGAGVATLPLDFVDIVCSDTKGIYY